MAALREVGGKIWDVVRVPSFVIIILQGIVGSTPANALVFLTLYLQLLGMTDFTASALLAIYLMGTAVGGFLGGWVGDRVAERYPNHGRICVVQFSVGVGIPLSILLLKYLPVDGTQVDTAAYHALVLLLHGLLTSWAAPACNNPIFAEIVPPSSRNLVYSFDRSFEGAVSAMGAPLVGIFAERVYGFKGSAATGPCPWNGPGPAPSPPPPPSPTTVPPGTPGGPNGQNLERAAALGSAMLFWLVVPWTVCCVFYTGLHITYPRDRRRARALGRG